jgi:hypothetical protein
LIKRDNGIIQQVRRNRRPYGFLLKLVLKYKTAPTEMSAVLYRNNPEREIISWSFCIGVSQRFISCVTLISWDIVGA